MSTTDIPDLDPAAVGPPAPRATLIDVFEATVAAHGGRLALDTPTTQLTYAALAERVRELAGRLRHGGVGPGDRVGVRVASGTADLYVAILGALMAGAAYVPVDRDDPDARAEQIFTDANACVAIGDDLELAWRGEPEGGVGRPHADDDAWIIFTSGSTGAPKGVAVSHRAAVAFIDGEAELWRVHPEDRVLAGLSVAFDASCEEMWLAWANGAALVPAPRALVRSGVELGPWLAEREVTVISTVPTLAAIWDDSALASVRLLILGGEACPEPLVQRLAPTRELWNTYGPTEATVVSTAIRLLPGVPVTIGDPLRGWELAIVDEHEQPAEEGELVIGGVGLGRYLRADLDAERYRPLPALGWDRAYRTGDIVRRTRDGLAFVGRRDHQVKIGGRRIELGELDDALNATEGVRAAATVVRESAAGNKLLVGYVTGAVTAEHVRADVADRLPASLVPMIVVLDDMPLATSGKVDRKALPWPPPETNTTDGELTEAQRALADHWREQLGPVAIGPDSDFFALGGTSLAAAKLISVLRVGHPAVAVADVYEHRTLSAFATHLEAIAGPQITDIPELSLKGMRTLQALQLVGVFVLFAIQAVPWLLGTLVYGNLVDIGTPHVHWVALLAAWVLLASPPAHVALQFVATRVLLRDVEPGRYPRASWLAARLWFIDRLAEVTRYERLGGTPWAAKYARLVGAKVGDGARLATVPPAGSLLTVGAGATIEGNVDLRGWWIDGQELVVGAIEIGPGARIGSRSMLNPGAVIGTGAELEPGTVVDGHVPAHERWGGAPARKVGHAGDHWPKTQPPATNKGLWPLAFAFSLGLELLLSLAAFLPALGLLALLGSELPTLSSSLDELILEVLVITVIAVPLTALIVALTLRLVWRLVKPGWHGEHGPTGWALWFGEELKKSSITLLFPLYASRFTRNWYRLMGIKIGKGTELSVSTGLNPLVSFGELAQGTDDIGFCTTRSRDGWLAVEPIAIGDRTFLGPGSILRGDTRLGDDSLLGVMTLSPMRPDNGTSWLGVPALELPRHPDAADAARTTNPPRRLRIARGVMDTLRLLGPNAIALFVEIMELTAMVWVVVHAGVLVGVLAAPFVLLAGGVVCTAITVALKWLLIGRYTRSQHPLWSAFVWRDEMMNAAQEQLADEKLLRLAIGTPLMSLYLRAMGAKVGRGVWCETTAVTEYDMITLDDGAAVNRGACLMTHLFHDRLLRIGPTHLEQGATLGPTAVVLPDTRVGASTTIEAHSVVLRGEELPAGTRWHGTPVTAR
ncbi:amino acid adenylation domain-containing protein [Solirubrobacter phytolaccae]|uniref:Amino acid adenylation domain-containing protein n=1 Tax=Solirubrobacter phytolaccae TaxID=1404360 RepID=A0A9X3SE48_9ACTN|nr:Pls/PosA family non-ribosomal peptide synthetase [Solirubrobacter phytolaccae]MDA0180032.1 amino acid adenylation domain-containing protein [Solirubrobacter phytolaccae]